VAGGVVAIGRHVPVASGVRAFELTLNEPEGEALQSIEAVAQVASDLGLELGAGTVRAGHRDAIDFPVARSAVPLPVVIDPVGAGDGFCAGFMAARLQGMDLAVALDIANACGAAVASALGDQSGLPGEAELAAVLRSGTDARVPDTLR
jgi:2-dehydro-3-deoxygluconokinase